MSIFVIITLKLTLDLFLFVWLLVVCWFCETALYCCPTFWRVGFCFSRYLVAWKSRLSSTVGNHCIISLRFSEYWFPQPLWICPCVSVKDSCIGHSLKIPLQWLLYLLIVKLQFYVWVLVILSYRDWGFPSSTKSWACSSHPMQHSLPASWHLSGCIFRSFYFVFKCFLYLVG